MTRLPYQSNYDRVLLALEDLAVVGNDRPTIREIMAQADIPHISVVMYQLGRLERAGRIVRVRNQARGVQLVGLPRWAAVVTDVLCRATITEDGSAVIPADDVAVLRELSQGT